MSSIQPPDGSRAHAIGPDDPPVLDMTVGDLLRRAVAMAPERAAIVEGVPGPDRRRWTYRELLRDAEACVRLAPITRPRTPHGDPARRTRGVRCARGVRRPLGGATCPRGAHRARAPVPG